MDIDTQQQAESVPWRIDEVKRKGRAIFETTHVARDGRVIPTEVSSNIIRHRGRECIMSTARDITDRRAAEEELRRTSDYLESLMGYANAPIIVWDSEFKIQRFNHAFERLTGYAADEVIYKEIGILFPVETREESLGRIERTLSDEFWESVEIPILRKDGSTRIALWNSANIYDRDGKTTIATIAQGQDITERKASEKALKEEQAFTEMIINSLKDVFYVLSVKDNGLLVRWNKSLSDESGYTDEELARMTVLDLFDAEGQKAQQRFFEELMTNGSAMIEIDAIMKGGKRVPYQFRSTLVRDEKGNPFCVTGVGRDITESKVAENALIMSEGRYRSIVTTLPDGIAVTDLIGTVTDVSNRLVELYACEEASELIGKNYNDFLPLEEDREKATKELQSILESGVVKVMELTLIRPDGSRFDGEISASTMKDVDGNPGAIISVVRDITERKAAKKELLLCDSAISSAMNAMAIADLDGKLNHVNKAFLGMWGLETEQEALGRSGTEFWEMGEKAQEIIEQLLEKVSWRGELTAQRKDGSLFPVELFASMVLSPDGAPAGILAWFADITDRKAAEEALLESEDKYRTLIDSLNEGIWVIDQDARTTFVNERMAEMLGYTVDEMMGKELFFFMEESDVELVNMNIERRKQGIEEQHDFEFLKKDGTPIFTTLETSVLYDDEGNYAGVLAGIMDITERKWAQAEISRLSRLVVDEYEEARRKIAIDLHDEFGQSITALKIEFDMLMKEAGERLGDQAERLEGIVALLEDALYKIRSISGDLRPVLLDDFGLEKALGLYVAEFSSKTGITASADCAAVPAHLGSNVELALFRIAQEALVNIARHAGATRVRVSLLWEDGMIRLTVADNGHGFDIDKAIRGGSTHSPFGILGMRERAAMVGGELNLSSKITKGTTVAVTVPIEPGVE